MAAHESVLLKESINALSIKPDGIYIDGTFGRGGHSQAILDELGASGRLFAVDKDPDAIAVGEARFKLETRFKLIHGSFSQIKAFCEAEGIVGKVDGILLDLGVSSPQLDNAERGFSFLHDGPLDMRMDTTQELNAKEFIEKADVEEMVRVFRDYGEERFAKRIAGAIDRARLDKPIESTRQLAEIVKEAHPRWERHKHPATRVFQAIRIHINQELADIERCLKEALGVLATGGRIAVISFHSLEDRMIKQFMRREEKGEIIPKNLPILPHDIPKTFKRVGRAVKPSDEEIKGNKRARSAVLRVGEKLL